MRRKLAVLAVLVAMFMSLFASAASASPIFSDGRLGGGGGCGQSCIDYIDGLLNHSGG